MKLVKIFGVVMAVHVAVFMFVFAIPGCRSTGKKPSAPAVATSDIPPAGASELGSPLAGNTESPSDVSSGVRFSPTRPGTAAATAVNEPVAAAPADASYTVVKGDNLWTIAKKHNVTVKQITAANNMRSDSTLKLGQKLTIPGKTATTSTSATTSSTTSQTSAAPAATSTSTVSHTVKSGETLGGIAKKYQVKVGEIATANNIADPTKLRVGQTLKIPGQASATRTPAARPAQTAPGTFTPAPSVAPVTAPATTAPTTPIFTSPLESSPESSPFATPASSDTPLIRVEESGAPKIE
ncbi:MAG: LysM peptidoglycan-binding domain-containing protein [Rariglobus sp.]